MENWRGASLRARRRRAEGCPRPAGNIFVMSKRIVIDPVTRIEGHAKISIFMDDAGNVADA